MSPPGEPGGWRRGGWLRRRRRRRRATATTAAAASARLAVARAGTPPDGSLAAGGGAGGGGAGDDGGIGDGNGGRTGAAAAEAAAAAAAEAARRHPEHFLICGLLGVLQNPKSWPWTSGTCSCRSGPHQHRPLHDDQLSHAGRCEGGQGGATADTWRCLTTRVGRAGAVPLATQGYPTTVWAASVEAALRGCR